MMKPLTGKDKPFSSTSHPTRPKDCKRLRRWLAASLCRHLGPEAGWVRRHAAGCPKCQRRIAAFTRVELALSIVKSQPHCVDLLQRANACAIGMLKHSLREAPQAHTLKDSRPGPSFIERSGRYRYRLGNVAACLAIVVLTRTGLFSSLDRMSTQGKECMRQYYATQAGEDLAGEVFGV
ncbi:MAG: hypothetical protein JW741_17185 [Sedimentisphaerales bacterium]|nr:hypothetical protein [Sedimentisphaerales bacterium]